MEACRDSDVDREDKKDLVLSKLYQINPRKIADLECIFIQSTTPRIKNTEFILALHGAGFIAGNPNQEYLLFVAKYTGCTVVSVDYKLAETWLSQTIDDIIQVYDYLIENSQSLDKLMNVNNLQNWCWNHNNAALVGDSWC